MTNLTLQNFWQGKKIAALVLSFIIVVVTLIINQIEGLNIDPNIIFGILGLNALYVLNQGSIDAKKTDTSAFKPFWESRKFIAIAIGNVVPIIVGIINKKYETGITSEMILGLLGINVLYMWRQGSLDSKDPNNH